MILSNSSKQPLQIDRYKVLNQLGKGGFGTVYHVKDTYDGKEYALKLLHKSLNVNRIKTQLKVLKALQESTLFLKTYLSKKMMNSIFLLFEYTPELNLDKLVKKEILSEKEAVDVLLQLLNSLEFLHTHNIIHGDIKAENIMKKGNQFYLIDYDTAKIGSEVTTLHILNDDDFSAPEIYKGKELYSSDIYSLGCTLYYMLRGEHLYGLINSDDFSKKMFAHLYTKPFETTNISKKMFYLILRMTDKNYKNRATIEEIKSILNNSTPIEEIIFLDKTEDNFASVYERYKFMAEDGIAYAQNVFGLIHEEGIETQQDMYQAFLWYERAAKQGLAKAEFNLALCYKMAKGCKVDYKKSIDLFTKASNQGHNRSYFHLGEIYEQGLGAEVNMKKARYYYEQSALNGYKPAYKKLKELFE